MLETHYGKLPCLRCGSVEWSWRQELPGCATDNCCSECQTPEEREFIKETLRQFDNGEFGATAGEGKA